MAEKLPTTPDGMICKVCGQDKPRYHFFYHSGVYNHDFFTTQAGFTSGVCWECAGPYRCIVCHEIKPASAFRVQGRTCQTCREAIKMTRQALVLAQENDFDANQVTEYTGDENAPEMVDSE